MINLFINKKKHKWSKTKGKDSNISKIINFQKNTKGNVGSRVYHASPKKKGEFNNGIYNFIIRSKKIVENKKIINLFLLFFLLDIGIQLVSAISPNKILVLWAYWLHFIFLGLVVLTILLIPVNKTPVIIKKIDIPWGLFLAVILTVCTISLVNKIFLFLTGINFSVNFISKILIFFKDNDIEKAVLLVGLSNNTCLSRPKKIFFKNTFPSINIYQYYIFIKLLGVVYIIFKVFTKILYLFSKKIDLDLVLITVKPFFKKVGYGFFTAAGSALVLGELSDICTGVNLLKLAVSETGLHNFFWNKWPRIFDSTNYNNVLVLPESWDWVDRPHVLSAESPLNFEFLVEYFFGIKTTLYPAINEDIFFTPTERWNMILNKLAFESNVDYNTIILPDIYVGDFPQYLGELRMAQARYIMDYQKNHAIYMECLNILREQSQFFGSHCHRQFIADVDGNITIRYVINETNPYKLLAGLAVGYVLGSFALSETMEILS